MKEKKQWWLLVVAALFVLDVSMGGSGVWSENILGFSVRKILFLSLFLYALALSVVVTDVRLLIYLCCVVLFYLVWGFLIPGLYNNLDSALKDFPSLFGISFLVLLAMKMPASVIASLVVFAARCSLLLAFIHCFIATMLYFEVLPLSALNSFFLEHLVREGEVYIFSVEPSFRVFWASSSFMIIGYVYYIAKFLVGSRKSWLSVLVPISIHCVALILTDTRAFQLFMILVLVIYALLLLIQRVYFGPRLLVAVFYVLALVVFEIIILLSVNPEFLSSLGLAKPGEGSERYDQVSAIFISFSDSLFWGKGFGASAEGLIRSEIAPWSYEMSIAALLMKLGLIGVLFILHLLFASLVIPFICSIREISGSSDVLVNKEMWVLASAGVSYLLVVSTNPFLFSLVGFSTVFVFYSWYVFIAKYNRGLYGFE